MQSYNKCTQAMRGVTRTSEEGRKVGDGEGKGIAGKVKRRDYKNIVLQEVWGWDTVLQEV